MGAVTKRFIIGLVIFAVAALAYLGTMLPKAEASVSWGQEQKLMLLEVISNKGRKRREND